MKCPECKVDNAPDHNYCKHCGFPLQAHALERDLRLGSFDVLRCLVEGVTSNRKLAHRLGVSENTVKFHVRNILDKLHLHNRAQVVSYAIRHRIVATPET